MGSKRRLEVLRNKASYKEPVNRTVGAPCKVSGSELLNPVGWSVFNDFQAVEPKQNIDQLIVVHLKRRDDFLEFPVIDDQVGDDKNLRLIGKRDFLRFTQLCHESQVLGWLHQVIQCEADPGTDLVEPTQREIASTHISLDRGFANSNPPGQLPVSQLAGTQGRFDTLQQSRCGGHEDPM